MTYAEINNLTQQLAEATNVLERTYVENEGEVTEQTEALEEQIEAMKSLLANEGVDDLGRWLKAKEDEAKTLKAEKDYISRKIAAIANTTDFIKAKVYEILEATGKDKVKGRLGYSFTATTSSTCTIDKEALNNAYKGIAEKALRDAGVPEYIGISLTASSTKAEELGLQDGDDAIFQRETKNTVRFTKPRASKGE